MFDDSGEDGLLQGLGVDDRPHAGPHIGDAQSRQLAQPAHLVLGKKCGKDVTRPSTNGSQSELYGYQLQAVWFEADQWQLVWVNDRPHAGPHVGHAQSRQLA